MQGALATHLNVGQQIGLVHEVRRQQDHLRVRAAYSVSKLMLWYFPLKLSVFGMATHPIGLALLQQRPNLPARLWIHTCARA